MRLTIAFSILLKLPWITCEKIVERSSPLRLTNSLRRIGFGRCEAGFCAVEMLLQLRFIV
jgi:hypothetical protein